MAPLLLAPYRETFCERQPSTHLAPAFGQGSSASKSAEESAHKALANVRWASTDLPLDKHYLTHLPKHPGCKACSHCKVQRKACKDRQKARAPFRGPAKPDQEQDKPTKFGDLITSDHIMALNERSRSRHGDTTAHVCRDRATKWLEGLPAAGKSKPDIVEQIHQLLGGRCL